MTEKPEALLLNYRSIGYCLVRFDDDSKAFLIRNLKYMEDRTARTYIWRIFREMMHCGDLSVQEWVKLIENNLDFENIF